jgi:fatty acid desaturase
MVEEVNRDTSRRRQYLQWHHGITNIIYILVMHTALIGWLWYGRHAMPYMIFVLVSILACVIHQRILSEWFHEATHWNIVPDRTWSDWIGDLLIGSFNGTRAKSNRPGHFKHHAATQFFTLDDPDTRSSAASNREELVRGILRDLSGRTAIEAFLGALDTGAEKAGEARFGNIAWFIWLVAVHGLGVYLTVSAGYYEIYPIYFLTLLTLYPVANRFRLYVQHAWIREDGTIYLVESGASRTYLGGLVTQLFLISPMIMYHYEHHAWPSLPYRALRAMVKRSSDPNVYGTHPFRILGKVLVGL